VEVSDAPSIWSGCGYSDSQWNRQAYRRKTYALCCYCCCHVVIFKSNTDFIVTEKENESKRRVLAEEKLNEIGAMHGHSLPKFLTRFE
jgi:hypothetical protein